MARRRDDKRTLTLEEAKVWRKVTASAEPLKPDKSVGRAPDKDTKSPPGSQEASKEQPQKKPRLSRPVSSKSRPAPKPIPQPPPLTGLDRRTSQRLARGQVEIDARLDLHGHRRETARQTLLSFLAKARGRGARCILVITGKGESGLSGHTLHGARFYHPPERRAVLRAAMPSWLEEPEFRAHVAGYQPAHPRHGGGGAFYVWLRRRRPVSS